MRSAIRSASSHLLAVVAVLALLLGTISSAFAQATPEASGGSGPALGDTIALVDSNGEATLQITVSTLTDPDDAAGDAERGFHWIGLELTVVNVSDTDFSFAAYPISLIDGEGFLTQPAYPSRSSEDQTARPGFVDGTIPLGGSVSGWVFYQVFNGSVPAWIIFNDGYGLQQFAVLANLGGEAAAAGSPTTLYDASAEEIGTVTINEIIPAFEEVDTSIQTKRGVTIVALDVTVTNTGTSELQPSNSTFYIVDDFGFMYYVAYVSRSGVEANPDLTNDVIAPGASSSGVVLFEIPDEAVLSLAYFQPIFEQLYILAQTGPGNIVATEDIVPPAIPTVSVESSPVTEAAADCADVTIWADATTANISPFSSLAIFQTENLSDVTTQDMRDASDAVAAMAEVQAGIVAPASAEALNETLLTFLDTYTDLFTEAADRIEGGEDPAVIDQEFSDRPELNDLITELFTEIESLSTTCPDVNLDNILG